MNRSSVVIAALAMLAAVAPASAHLVETRGAASCETWLKERPNNAKLHESWLLGFLSGVSQEADIHFPKAMDNAALFKWMDDYCRQNPRQTIQLGGFMLMGKLRSTLPPDPNAK
jgi:hypothetical protein